MSARDECPRPKRRSLLVVALLGFGLVLGAVAGGVAATPEWRAVKPPGLALAFELRSSWRITDPRALGNGWKWEALSPGQGAWIGLTSEGSADPFPTLAAAFVANLRSSSQQAVDADPVGGFSATRTRVAGVPAVEVTIEAQTLTSSGATQSINVEYLLSNAGFTYILGFASASADPSPYLAVLSHLIRSLHFIDVA